MRHSGFAASGLDSVFIIVLILSSSLSIGLVLVHILVAGCVVPLPFFMGRVGELSVCDGGRDFWVGCNDDHGVEP